MEPKYKLGDYVWCFEYNYSAKSRLIYGQIEGIELKPIYTSEGTQETFEYKLSYMLNGNSFVTNVSKMPENQMFNTFEEAEKYVLEHLYDKVLEVQNQSFENHNGRQCNEQYTERFRSFLKQKGKDHF